MSAVQHINSSDFASQVLHSPQPVLVDFYANWCPPCRALAPVLEDVAERTTGARIVKVNVDENPDLAEQFRIEALPSLLLFKNGQPTVRHAGLLNAAQVQQLLAM